MDMTNSSFFCHNGIIDLIQYFNINNGPSGSLTHWGRVTHICVNRLTTTGSDNGLSPGRRQAIIWTNAGILLIGPLGTNFSENLIKILTFSFTKMRLKVSSAKWRPFCLGLNVLMKQLHFQHQPFISTLPNTRSLAVTHAFYKQM